MPSSKLGLRLPKARPKKKTPPDDGIEWTRLGSRVRAKKQGIRESGSKVHTCGITLRKHLFTNNFSRNRRAINIYEALENRLGLKDVLP